MHEAPEDLERLQGLLDDSYARGGRHLTSIHTEAARLAAAEVVARLPWMQVFVAATVSSDGRPFTGPVDTFLFRGRLWFGTSEESLRARHLRDRPGVSLTHVRGERLVVTVHGRAERIELQAQPGFAAHLRAHYGAGFDRWELGANPYYVVHADRWFAADMGVHASADRSGAEQPAR